MVIKIPSVLTLDNGKSRILFFAKKINGRDFGLVSEVPTVKDVPLVFGVAELKIVDGQAIYVPYDAPDEAFLINHLLESVNKS